MIKNLKTITAFSFASISLAFLGLATSYFSLSSTAAIQKLALYQYEIDAEPNGEDQKFSNRTLAFNAAKERAKIPLSQNFVDQWIVGNNSSQPRTNNYIFSNNLGALGRYYKYDTPDGSRVIVDHTSDPSKALPHFHAGQPKDAANKAYDFRANRYRPVNGSHHYYYNP